MVGRERMSDHPGFMLEGAKAGRILPKVTQDVKWRGCPSDSRVRAAQSSLYGTTLPSKWVQLTTDTELCQSGGRWGRGKRNM